MKPERLREKLSYDPHTGIFIWRESGKVAGHKDRKGYITIRVDTKLYLAHRLAWLYMYGQWPMYYIDHIDRNPDNNKLENLRDVPQSVNEMNRGLRCTNKSGATGVHFEYGRWAARYKGKYLGRFHTREEAIQAREKFATLN